MSLSRKFFYNLHEHSGDFFKRIFTILLQIQHENNFLPIPVDTDKAKLVAFLVIVCTAASFIGHIACYENVSKRVAILALIRKQ